MTVKAEGPVPGLADQVRELLPNALEVTVDYPRATPDPATSHTAGPPLEPAALFTHYYRRKNGADPTEDLLELFHSVYEEAHG